MFEIEEKVIPERKAEMGVFERRFILEEDGAVPGKRKPRPVGQQRSAGHGRFKHTYVYTATAPVLNTEDQTGHESTV